MDRRHKDRRGKDRLTAEAVIKTITANRRENLCRLIGSRFQTQVALANALGVTTSYLSQLIGPRPTRKLSEPTARKFEYRLGLPTGALDHDAS